MSTALRSLCLGAVLAAVFPWQLGPPADALKPAPPGIHPEWYFMSQFQTLKILGRIFPGMAGEAIGMTLFTLGMVLWFLIPLYDKKSKGAMVAKRATYFGILVVAILLGTSIWGYLALG